MHAVKKSIYVVSKLYNSFGEIVCGYNIKREYLEDFVSIFDIYPCSALEMEFLKNSIGDKRNKIFVLECINGGYLLFSSAHGDMFTMTSTELDLFEVWQLSKLTDICVSDTLKGKLCEFIKKNDFLYDPLSYDGYQKYLYYNGCDDADTAYINSVLEYLASAFLAQMCVTKENLDTPCDDIYNFSKESVDLLFKSLFMVASENNAVPNISLTYLQSNVMIKCKISLDCGLYFNKLSHIMDEMNVYFSKREEDGEIYLLLFPYSDDNGKLGLKNKIKFEF